MSAKTAKQSALVVGGPPRADLLPLEIKAEARARSQRRLMVALVALVAVVIAGGYVLAQVIALGSAVRLMEANEKTALLVAEQAEYIEVRQIGDQVVTTEAARRVAMATEIDWKSYLTQVTATLPADTTIASFAATSATAIADFTPSTAAFAKPRVAEMTVTATSSSLTSIADWADNLESLPGFVDALATPITGVDGAYSVSMVIHLDQGALANRFAVDNEEATADATTPEGDTATEGASE
jgi:hypothetical protein